MIKVKDTIFNDLSAFADLGTDAPSIVEVGNDLVIHLLREGRLTTIVTQGDGAVIERAGGSERTHRSIRALLASPSFGNLGQWADRQKLMLREQLQKETIPISGRLLEQGAEGTVDVLDDALLTAGGQSRTVVTLVDGPAGIGKTGVIRSLAFRRANNYRQRQSPLVLHVESRGRMLQNITDLMAFSLQTLRLNVTYDQIPSLVRNGLVTLAIDGFDELGDPSGYDLAWAQVNDLVSSSRGHGTIILSGRETFVGKERMMRALNALDETQDTIQTFTLRLIPPVIAKRWLIDNDWPEDTFDLAEVAPLFESESYALRPFFLRELAREGVASQIRGGELDDLLSFLMNAMIKREATKFGRDVEVVTDSVDRESFVRRFMEEVARDLAENQTDAIPSDTLTWLADVVASDVVQADLIGILKNRAGVIAFLGDDERRGYKRFVHEQVLNYFLSHVTIRCISEGEVPKYIRRNIFGIEFLENFCSVVRYADSAVIDSFVLACVDLINKLGDSDRSRRNLAALVLATCSVTRPKAAPLIKDVSLDEAYLTETSSEVKLRSVTIGQLYARQADLRGLEFDKNCFIVSLVADESTVPSETIPLPTTISLQTGSLTTPEEKNEWFSQKFEANITPHEDVPMRELVKRFGLFDLLSRIARYKPYWLREGDEKAARRILDDPNWSTLKDIMLRHELLVERGDFQASGRHAPFYHVRNRQTLLLLDKMPDSLRPFISDVFKESFRAEGYLKE